MIPSIYHAQILLPQADGSTYKGNAGSFMIADGQLHHLSSYHDGHLANIVPAGPVTDETYNAIHNPPPNFKIGKREDIAAGHHLDMVPVAKLEKPYIPEKESKPEISERRPSVFLYQRAGHDKPHVLEVSNGQFVLDGNPLSHTEVAKIIENLKNGVAISRYRLPMATQAVQKAETVFRNLYKAGDRAQEALAHFASIGNDPTSQEALQVLRKQIYQDQMMGPEAGWGNRYAWERFKEQNRPGVYGSLDLNDLKEHNSTHGHEGGDAAIRAWGMAGRKAADAAAPGKIKLFHPSGDEGVFYAEHPEHAYAFLREFHKNLNAAPPVGGTHQVSMASGLGPDYATADKALYLAKERKYKKNWLGRKVLAHKPGQTPNLSNSLLPGSEGPVPQEGIQVPGMTAPPLALPTAVTPQLAAVPAASTEASQSVNQPVKAK